MGRNRKKQPLQPLDTEIETVAAALGVRQSDVTTDLLKGLQAGLVNTVSPLKDAVEHLVQIADLKQRRIMLLEALQAMLDDEQEQIKEKSSTRPIVRNQERWEQTIDDLQDVCFRLM